MQGRKIQFLTSPAGGYGTYEFSVDGGGSWQLAGTFSNLTPDTYDVRIRDAANPACSVILHPNLVITEPLTLAMSTTGNITLDCFDDHDGMGTFFAYGGTMPYTFVVLSNTTGGVVSAPGFNSLTFYNAVAGSIRVSVVDYNGCSAETTINVSQPALLTPGSISADQVVCFGDNPATLTEVLAPSGGPGAFRYQWQYAANAAGPFMNIAMATSLWQHRRNILHLPAPRIHFTTGGWLHRAFADRCTAMWWRYLSIRFLWPFFRAAPPSVPEKAPF